MGISCGHYRGGEACRQLLTAVGVGGTVIDFYVQKKDHFLACSALVKPGHYQ